MDEQSTPLHTDGTNAETALPWGTILAHVRYRIGASDQPPADGCAEVAVAVLDQYFEVMKTSVSTITGDARQYHIPVGDLLARCEHDVLTRNMYRSAALVCTEHFSQLLPPAESMTIAGMCQSALRHAVMDGFSAEAKSNRKVLVQYLAALETIVHVYGRDPRQAAPERWQLPPRWR